MELLQKACSEMDLSITEEMQNKFLIYKDLLLEWNKKVNLTAIISEPEVILKHFADSLTLLTLKELDSKDLKIIDVGTGAGFPSVPIKILRDDFTLTLVDSLNKRVSFLNELTQELSLTKVECIHSRAEDLGKNENYREKYNICVSRAVSNMSTLVEYCLPFVEVGGKFIALKGNSVKEEISTANKAIMELGGEVTDIKPIKIPFTDIEHMLVIISKLYATPRAYPRKANQIQKKPIL